LRGGTNTQLIHTSDGTKDTEVANDQGKLFQIVAKCKMQFEKRVGVEAGSQTFDQVTWDNPLLLVLYVQRGFLNKK